MTTIPTALEAYRRQPSVLWTTCSTIYDNSTSASLATIEFERLALQDDAAKRIMTIPGVGPITALGMVATLGNARDFKNGRQLAAWLGFTPKQHSSGGKTRLGGVTKRCDDYLRTLLVQGARAAMQHPSRAEPTRLSRWASNLVARRGYHKASG